MKINVVAPILYGLEDFSCLPSVLRRCGLRRASAVNPSTVVCANFRDDFNCHEKDHTQRELELDGASQEC